MLFQSLELTNVLSFGPETEPVHLGPLNVLIGPNGSGKSNFVEAIGLLRAAPRDLAAPIREGGGIGEWIWKEHRHEPGNGSGLGHGEYRGARGEGSGLGDGAGSGSGSVATLEAILSFQPSMDPNKRSSLRHRLSFAAAGQRFELTDERLESETPGVAKKKPFLYLGYERGRPMLNVKGGKGERALKRENLHPERFFAALESA